MPSRYSSALCTFLLVMAAPVLVPAVRAAGKTGDAADPTAKIQQLNRTAMQYFDDLNYALAEKTLLDALAMVEKAGLQTGPAVLSTHGNLAVLYSAGLKKADKAMAHFKKALALKPDLKLSKLRTSPETEANLARAKAELAGGGEAAAGVKPAETAAADALSCPTTGEIQAGDEITFTCTTGEAMQAAAVMLYYKANDGEEYQAHRMTKEGTTGGVITWVAKVPGAHTQANSIPFYMEATDPSGATLATSGREDSPNVIAVRGAGVVAGPPPVTEGEGEEEEEEEEEIDDSNPLAGLERERWREHQGSKGTWLFALGAGSGVGYASGKSTEAFGKYGVGFSPGVAPASLGQVVWEVAYFVGRKTALAVGGRHQGIFGGPAGTATGAHSVLVRSLFFTEDEGKLRWYFALVAGGGEGFRLTVKASINDVNSGAPTGYTVKDTVRGGPAVAGAGGGMLYKIGRRWRLTLDTQVLVGIPKTSVVLDLTGGVRWQY